MASAGPSAPTSATQSGSGTPWSTPGNIETSGSSYAALAINSLSVTSQLLKGEVFGFSIPGGATINGIVVALYNGAVPTVGGLNSVQLMKLGAVVGTSKTPSSGLISLGSSADLWGTTWAAADINNAGFGVAVLGGGTDYYTVGTITTNAWEVTVYYTPAGTQSVASCVGLFGF